MNASPEVFSESNSTQLSCNDSFMAARQGTLPRSLKPVIAFIDQNYMQKLTLEIVASHVYLHKTYISQMFTKHLGITFVSYLEGVRINEAQELLRTTDISIGEIAAAVGYASSSYFSKAFTKRVGIAPSQYRDNMFGK